MEYQLLQEIILLLAVAVVCVALFMRLRLPAILAYLCIGIALGPSGLGLIESDSYTHTLAEIGVVFLLFTIGLEFSLPQLIKMRHTVFLLGGAQILFTSVPAGVLAWYFNVPPIPAIIVGGILALSSTAIVIKQLSEQLELNSRHGRLAVGILLFQDLAAIPLLVIIPALANDGDPVYTLLWLLVKAVIAVLLMLAAGRWLLRPIFHEVARTRSPELFTLTVLLISLAAAYLTHLAGLSMALGAFIAGMMISETEYRHQVETDIRPFQDVFLGLFFITVGMLVDLSLLPTIWPLALTTAVVLILGKTLIISLIMRFFGHASSISLRTALLLAQGGEFSFALLTLASNNAILERDITQVLVLAILLSMALAPFLIRYNGPLSHFIFRAQMRSQEDTIIKTIRQEAAQLSDHVILCGYGRVGQNLARLLEREGLPYLAFDLDPTRMREAMLAGERVFFGSATNERMLHAANIRHARLLVISFDDASAALKIMSHARRICPDLPILVRTRDDSHLYQLQNAGATEVVPETVEASLMLGAHMLTLLNLPTKKVLRIMQDIRADRYQLMRAYFHGDETDLSELDADASHKDKLQAVTLPADAYAVGKRLSEVSLDNLDVMVTAVRRGGIRGPDPGPETQLCEGDVLILHGNRSCLSRAQERLLNG